MRLSDLSIDSILTKNRYSQCINIYDICFYFFPSFCYFGLNHILIHISFYLYSFLQIYIKYQIFIPFFCFFLYLKYLKLLAIAYIKKKGNMFLSENLIIRMILRRLFKKYWYLLYVLITVNTCLPVLHSFPRFRL